MDTNREREMVKKNVAFSRCRTSIEPHARHSSARSCATSGNCMACMLSKRTVLLDIWLLGGPVLRWKMSAEQPVDGEHADNELVAGSNGRLSHPGACLASSTLERVSAPCFRCLLHGQAAGSQGKEGLSQRGPETWPLGWRTERRWRSAFWGFPGHSVAG